MSSGERKSYLSVSVDGPTFFLDDVALMKKLNCLVVLTNSHLFQTSDLISLNVKLLGTIMFLLSFNNFVFRTVLVKWEQSFGLV